MKTNLLFLLLFVTTGCFAQVTYDKGYFIDNNNQKVECLIKNYDWKNNPKSFEYKLTENDKPKKGDLFTVKEFGIYGYSKYIRAYTNIDRSPMEASNLSNKRTPDWTLDTMFLKVIVEGKASLYYYDNGYIERFFYSESDAPIQQLIYKDYIPAGTEVATNSDYQNQLWLYVRNKNATVNSIQHLQYNMDDLEKYFKDYDEITEGSSISYQAKKRGFHVNIRITPGINISSLSIENLSISPRYANFGTRAAFRVGMEAEFLLPFNKYSWGILFEPTYQLFNASPSGTRSTVHFSSIEFPIGLRHYFILNKTWKVFVNGLYTNDYGFAFNSNFLAAPFYFETPYKISRIGASFAVGGGVDFSRISVEMRYYTDANNLDDYVYWTSKYSRFSIIFGFKIFGKNENK